MKKCFLSGFLLFFLSFFFRGNLAAQIGNFGVSEKDIPCCDKQEIQAMVYSGPEFLIPANRLAAYCGPVLWFSPDEPLLKNTAGREINIPETFPFEENTQQPVVYYRIRNILQKSSSKVTPFLRDSTDRSKDLIDLRQVVGIDLDFFFYYRSEEGFGRHQHDVESVEMQLVVWYRPECSECPYNLIITRVIGKAHGILWYDNTLEVDEFTLFPIHILVEEGKHASCTDKNGDGYFTPGYDVNKRINDAWGVRDILRSGTLFTGGYQSWMAKVRRPDHRVFPPLPLDSPLRQKYTEEAVYAPANVIYELRPFPSAEKADPGLVPFIADKGYPDWPEVLLSTGAEKFRRWADAESFVKSLSIALRVEEDFGFSFVFPLFIVKNFEEPLAGGFLVNRIYLKDKNLRDLAWTLLYTSSASRWIDGYFAGGYEFDVYDLPEGSEQKTDRKGDVVLETGVKFRFDMRHSPFPIFTKLTDFWGIRLGIKNTGAMDIKKLGYVFEIGAGTW